MDLLIIPDVHGRRFWIHQVYDVTHDKVIFLGDYLDHYAGESTLEQDIEALEKIIELKKSDPDKYVLLLGNHDCPYIWPDEYGKKLGSYWCRHDYENHNKIHKLFVDNLDLFKFAWECENEVYGKVLFTHAGVTNTFKKICGLEADKINEYFSENISELATVSVYRGGENKSGSPVWADVYEHISSQVPQVFQIFGHTYCKKPIIMKNFAMLDTGKDCWVLNDKGLFEV